MERVWRKVNQGLTIRSSSTKQPQTTATNTATTGCLPVLVPGQPHSTDTTSSAGFGESQVVAVQQRRRSNPTQVNTASSEKRRRRRRRSRPSRDGNSQSGGHSSGGHHKNHSSSSHRSNNNQMSLMTQAGNEQSLRQRAVARLKMFNFNLNWDLHMNQCKPCGPKSGNIITRRLCRNRRGEDNELYRSNSFKFERFERKEQGEIGSRTLRKQISVCDDYSLPIDFVKKRPSSFDPCLADRLPDNWASPSPQTEHVSFLEPLNLQQPLSAIPTTSFGTTTVGIGTSAGGAETGTLPHQQHSLHRQQHPQLTSAHISPSISAAATESVDQAVPIKTVEEIFDSKRSYKRGTARSRQPQTRKPSSNSEVKYINQNFSSGSSAPITSEEEDNDEEEDELSKIPELNSPDSISEDLIHPLPPRQSPVKTTVPDTAKRNPSPYYYSDLLKNKTQQEESQETTTEPQNPEHSEPKRASSRASSVGTRQKELGARYRKSSSLDTPAAEKEVCLPKRYSITEEGVRIIRCDSPSTTTSDDSDCSECRKRRDWHAQLAIVRANCNLTPSVDPSMPPHRMLGPSAVCSCATHAFGEDNDELFRPRSIFYVHQPGAQDCADCALSDNSANVNDDMTSIRTRQFYETAFDSKITRSDDDLDEVDRVTNQSVLIQLSKSNNSSTSNMVSSQNKENRDRSKRGDTKRSKSSLKTPSTTQVQTTVDIENTPDVNLSQDLEKLQIDKQLDNITNANSTSSSQLPLRGYTPSPPSTAPLPMKFPEKHERFFINSIKSAPNLPSSNVAQHPRLKDLRLDIQAIRSNEVPPSGSCDGSMNNSSYNSPKNSDRPRSTLCLEPERVLELKRSHRNHKQRGRDFSSTESMATSSSGGSMESLKSSTSEGNRSTSSSDSRHSSSLSSHSSDSGPTIAFPLRVPMVVHNKLNILSPISDKSSQEPGSETSDINRNSSQKQSPEDTIGGTIGKKENDENEAVKLTGPKRRSAPNKALLFITGPEIQGSDSGISLHSREDVKSRSNFMNLGIQRASLGLEKSDTNRQALPQDLNDLPFDMPKLRRRRAHLQQEPCTSGSVTSVDVGDLPFDMPKLRRRLRLSQNQNQTPIPSSSGMILQTSTESSGLSLASSSLSMRDSDNKTAVTGGFFKQSLTLNLNECSVKPAKKFGTLDLGLNFNAARSNIDLIDASIPLDRQGWYHGSISRIDAEKILRPLGEGSFLVRNSESTRQDYSLTLKSAKGFMHMRIQRDQETGQFILGQFSRPFPTIPDMIRHFCLNRLPVRGAEHMCLLEPVIAQIL
ncbi:uncharacterized protein LOC129770376 [Toxorhynchites rutilus septentrionalis]|uniref:uncharacterized protein LOC129770376 n=1 Tax=Toxorhynchites rutilus septentrionalis TaxID=329112 RepID=UPI00247A0680|nr:uncharacterized protein LOC129770376 [Toxorhynchites rutilus septentrionalis]XP_055629143.1 uncharacterized protein LOC129770376 [Toxorhynchites rutilus septentrionalis]